MSIQTHQLYRSRNKKVEPSSTNFGARLRGLIENKGLTLVEFAKSYGMAESQLHNWLKRREPPLAKHWPKLSKFFGVSEHYILTGHAALEDAPATYGRPESISRKRREIAVSVESSLARRGVSESKKERMQLASAYTNTAEPTAEQCREYFETYLEAARQKPGGLGHVWWNLQENFPLERPQKIKEPEPL